MFARERKTALKVHSEPLLPRAQPTAREAADVGERTTTSPHQQQLGVKRNLGASRRPNLRASLAPINPAGQGTLSEAVNLESLSTFPRFPSLTDELSLPYLQRQPRLLSTLQVFAEAELKKRGVSPDDGPSEAGLDVWREVFVRFIEAFGTYKPVLTSIKTEYDAQLERAAKRVAIAEAEAAAALQKLSTCEEESLARQRTHDEELRRLGEISPKGALVMLNKLAETERKDVLVRARHMARVARARHRPPMAAFYLPHRTRGCARSTRSGERS